MGESSNRKLVIFTSIWHLHISTTLVSHYSLDTFHWCRMGFCYYHPPILAFSTFALAHSFWQMQFVSFVLSRYDDTKSTFILRKLLNGTVHTPTHSMYILCVCVCHTMHELSWLKIETLTISTICVLYIKLKRPLVCVFYMTLNRHPTLSPPPAIPSHHRPIPFGTIICE